MRLWQRSIFLFADLNKTGGSAKTPKQVGIPTTSNYFAGRLRKIAGCLGHQRR
jgi:hypothetical protein